MTPGDWQVNDQSFFDLAHWELIGIKDLRWGGDWDGDWQVNDQSFFDLAQPIGS